MRALVAVFLLAAASASAATPAKAPRFEGRVCKPPAGHHIADCRIARRGTPDLSRAAWRALRGKEVTIDVKVDGLAPNPAAGGARSWPMIDSLAQPMGTLEMAANGPPGRAPLRRHDRPRHRARTCAATAARRASTSSAASCCCRSWRGAAATQAFVDTAALDQATPTGQAALAAFNGQLGGGTECAPAGREISRVRKLANPRVGAVAHARLSSGAINSVDEYDAKPAYGNIVYFMSNTTAVRAGGITRGMVRVGTAVAKVDTFGYCDPVERRHADVALLVDPHGHPAAAACTAGSRRAAPRRSRAASRCSAGGAPDVAGTVRAHGVRLAHRPARRPPPALLLAAVLPWVTIEGLGPRPRPDRRRGARRRQDRPRDRHVAVAGHPRRRGDRRDRSGCSGSRARSCSRSASSSSPAAGRCCTTSRTSSRSSPATAARSSRRSPTRSSRARSAPARRC